MGDTNHLLGLLLLSVTGLTTQTAEAAPSQLDPSIPQLPAADPAGQDAGPIAIVPAGSPGDFPEAVSDFAPEFAPVPEPSSAPEMPLALDAESETVPPQLDPSSESSAPEPIGSAPRDLAPRDLAPIEPTPIEPTPIPPTAIRPTPIEPIQIAQALPPIAPTQDGTGSQVNQSGDRLTITGGTQAERNLFHRFDRFNVPTGQTATFVTTPATRAIFSQISGGSASSIDGRLQVTGSTADLFVINPAGILFGPNARLDLGGAFTATTADRLGFTGDQWLTVQSGQNYGSLRGLPQSFGFSGTAALVNQGALAVPVGQALRLLGGQVINTGQLTAPGGEVSAIAVSGNSVVRIGDAAGLLTLSIEPGAALDAAPSLPQLLTGPTNLAEAGQLQVNGDGSIALAAAALPSGSAVIAGQVNVSHAGGQGGRVTVVGDAVQLQAARVDASGLTAGRIRIGGEYQGGAGLPGARLTTVDAGSVLRADAIAGTGGQVIVWSDGAAQFAGEATARGLTGGGLVETSGKQVLDVMGARVDAGSPLGQAGQWLLDPSDIEIVTGGTGAFVMGQFDPATVSTIAPATIEAALDSGTSITIITAGGTGGNGDIRLTDSINQLGGGTAQLTLVSRRFTRDPAAQINLTSTGAITFNLNHINSEATPPVASIQTAIGAIGTGIGARQINLVAGNYQGAAGVDLVTINKNVTINGIQPGVRIDGLGTSRGIFVTPGTTATLRNLAVTNGFTAAGESGSGGGILNEGNLTLDAVVVNNNRAGLDGGGIHSSAPTSRLVANNLTVVNNRAGVDGGGLFLGGNSQLTAVTADDNQAGNNGGGIYNLGDLTIGQFQMTNNTAVRGGAIANVGASSKVTSTNFFLTQNVASIGGGIFNDQGTLIFDDGAIDLNQATNAGGGIWSDGGTVNLRQVGLTGNTATRFGAGLWLNDTAAIVNLATFDNNQAIEGGGGIDLNGSTTLTVLDSTLRNNRADYGGAINTNVLNGPVLIERSTFTNNSADTDGGAICSDPTVMVRDSTFDGNTATRNGGAINNLGTLSLLGSNRFIGNQASQAGGAIFNGTGQSLTVTGATFTNNQATAVGGAINNSGLATINSSTFTNNRVTSAVVGSGGGAINNEDSAAELRIIDGTFTGNTSTRNGGAIDSLNGGLISIKNTSFSGNRAQLDGGAIFADQAVQLQLDRATFSNNESQASSGGAIHARGDTTIRNSSLIGNTSATEGGAIFSTDSFGFGNLTIAGTEIRSNTAATEGGGVYADGTLSIDQSTIDNNTATTLGGGLSFRRGVATIDNSIISSNTAQTGGGVYNTATLNIVDTQLDGNVANLDGGAIWSDSTLRIDGVTLLNNRSVGWGGAIVNRLGDATILGATFTGNRAGLGGGALHANQGSLAIDGSTFTNNQAQTIGGAIDISSTPNATITQTVLRLNTAASDGGGIMLRGDNALTLRQVILDQNRSGADGGGLYASGNSMVNLDRVTVSNNQAQGLGGGIFNRATLTIEAGSLIDGNTATSFGGGIRNEGTLTIDGTTLSKNQSVNDRGGAISTYGGAVTITNSTISNNRAIFGGGIEANVGSLIINNSELSSNESTAGSGGGIEAANLTLTIDNSQILNNTSADQGGGIGLFQADATIRNSELIGNSAAVHGGAIEGNASTLILDNLTIENNQAQFGGGISHRTTTGATPRTILTNSIIANNRAQDGGGIFLQDQANSQVRNTLIQGNQASIQGGGIVVGGNTSLDLTEVTIAQNWSGDVGGGLSAHVAQNFSGVIDITNSTIAQNQAVGNGGGLDFNPTLVGGTLNLMGSTVDNNKAGVDGGGISFGLNLTANIVNSTFTQNQADRHGGAINTYNPIDLNNVTIANNTANATGISGGRAGGVFVQSILPVSVTVANSIIAANANNAAPDVAGRFVDQGNNLIGIRDGSTGFTTSTLVGTAAAPINPLLAPLGNYGGLTQTMALLPGSPAIDAGNSTLPTDQRGIARVGAAADIGAFESRGFVVTAQSGDGQSSQINQPFAVPLGLSIASLFGEPVDGGQLTFSGPTIGAGALFAINPMRVPITGGMAQLNLTANGTSGSYSILATAPGLTPTTFNLTNNPEPVPPILPPEPIPPVLPGPIPSEPIPPEPMPSDPSSTTPAPIPEDALFDDPLRNLLDPRPLLPSDFRIGGTPPLAFVDGDAIEQIDRLFSTEYRQHWGTKSTKGGGSTLDQTRELLRKAQAVHQARSAVIYALFVPRTPVEQPGQVEFGAVPTAQMALAQRAKGAAIRDDDQLMLVLVPAVGPVVQQRLDVTRQSVLQQAKLFRLAVSDPEDEVSYRPLAQQIYQWLFAPVEPDVQRLDLNHVMYVVDAGLRTVPLAAMMRGDEFIVERYGLSMIPSVDLLKTSFGQVAPSLRPESQTTLAGGADRFMQLETLPAVSLELAAIADSQKMTQVLLNEAFTPGNLKSVRDQSKASLLHLATHAEFNAGDLPSSYLQFWDSQLTFDQIRSQGWEELELLILSACATAVSSPEAELGFAGLASATGVESTIGSLWNVSDLGTLALMAEFYGNLGESPLRVETLRRSQLALLQGKTNVTGNRLSTAKTSIPLPSDLLPSDWESSKSAEFRHPFYWSGFTLVGNPWW
jgi:filamentous hemagglutinin family protein